VMQHPFLDLMQLGLIRHAHGGLYRPQTFTS